MSVNIKTALSSVHGGTLWRGVEQAAIIIYLLAALAAFFFIPFSAIEYINTPFIGGFVEQTMVFNGTNTSDPSHPWQAFDQGLLFGYQLKAIDGLPVRNAAEMQNVLRRYEVGDTVRLQVLTPTGELKAYPVTLTTFSSQDQLAFFYLPYIIGLVYLVSGIWIFATRRIHASGRALAVFAASIGITVATLWDLNTSHIFSWLWTLSLALGGGSLITLALIFPTDDPLIARFPLLSRVGFILALVLAVANYFFLYNMERPTDYVHLWRAIYTYAGAGAIFAIFWLSLRRLRQVAAVEREQIKLILIGGLVSFGPIALWFLLTPFIQKDFPFTPYLLLPLVVFPLVIGYTIQRYRLLATDYLLSRVTLYGLMAILVAFGYALLVTGLGVAAKDFLPGDSPLIIGVAIFVIALLLNPIRQALERTVNAIFFRGQRTYQDRLQTFSGELTNLVDVQAITKMVRQYVEEALLPSRFHLYLLDPLSDQYIATPDRHGNLTSDLRFTIYNPLVQTLFSSRQPLFIADAESLPASLAGDRARIALLGAQVFVPLVGRERLAGWLALGPHLSGEPYSLAELRFLDAICDQASLAIERSQVVANLQNRVREMNVLSRVAQGVNITLRLDDILELIYAQTTQVVPADEFQIILLDREMGNLVRIFYVEQDERLSQLENQTIESAQSLEQEVINLRRPILTEDFTRECQMRSIMPEKTGVFAWMGVPLMAGAEIIGVMSLGKMETDVIYTQEQVNLVQSIADQAASAIIKVRLLEETDQRARQLSKLNEVTRQLTSTLETELLLKNILDSAVEILNCEAGSLVMVDEVTGELVFRVVDSPVASDLLGKRLKAGTGLLGKAVNTREPVIVNDVKASPDWFKKTDQQTGFVTRNLIAVPMIIKDEVIGVIEVLNKLDGTNFSRDDQYLLQAFASQAAVAIENARLYTQTDQALAARVEELSVMQRIDRELNTSLDTQRAMNIALEWALKQSGMSAGVAGLVEENGSIRIMAQKGYTHELEKADGILPDPQTFQLQEFLEDGVALALSLNGDGNRGLLKDAHMQLVIPIRRENATIGLMLLESNQSEIATEDTVAFLQRLSDHAAIAISNAQLYGAVQNANVAKSEFVSFVSHELKNPMTSIKGYTELIAAGAVGPINEAQMNFLSTIRTNVERMSTLVSDLADVSRIEAGRLRLDFKAVNAGEVTEEVTRSLVKQIEEKKQVLEVQIPEDLPMVWVDRTRLVQIITNLVSNATKYTPAEGKITIAAEATENLWDPQGAPRVVHMWVQDTGIGISEEDQKKIFQKFFRSEDPKTREAMGTGLGLNITKSLVEFQGGKIWFESEFRKGTTFHFTIPVAD